MIYDSRDGPLDVLNLASMALAVSIICFVAWGLTGNNTFMMVAAGAYVAALGLWVLSLIGLVLIVPIVLWLVAKFVSNIRTNPEGED